ncbi:MAG: hypothetical protein BJ554DRAFT_2279, partial [Olpidium bornovanus]
DWQTPGALVLRADEELENRGEESDNALRFRAGDAARLVTTQCSQFEPAPVTRKCLKNHSCAWRRQRAWAIDATAGYQFRGDALTLLWEKQLVDDDVVRVNIVRSEFLNHAFRLVEREKLGDADADKRRFVLVEHLIQSKISQFRGTWPERSIPLTGSLNWLLTSVMTLRMPSSLANMSSWLAFIPMSPDI